ncbi:glycosyltransferase [Qipengyuania qiaonensis]|uniref:Glycosyltransferase n=1 Tax=Qipengyuania qiaonensis TaxID=2867240 RepID=A0ABS7J7S6_9SPHN|nr:glycosyltransferase [Qipengyuania qiaonensis]MBX7483371.1 glycosyltransferase [Qipengyuania qiaonensis]
MKVLHVITGLNIGGAENMLAKLIEQGGADEAVVLSLLSPGPIAERITARGVSVHSLGMRRGIVGPGAMLRLPRLVETIAPDLIHGWMYHGNLAASFARRRSRRKLPLVWNIRHSIPDLAMESRQTRVLLKLSARISGGPEAIVYNAYVSRDQHEAIGYSAERGMVVPNGFDTARFAPDPNARNAATAIFGLAEDAFRVACVARLHPMKDQARLVEAAAIARERGCDIHLVFVGHGLEDPPAELKRLIEKRIPADRVTTSGARTDVADWLPGIDLLAVPSAWGEAFPNVIGEALACGVPVVATDVGDSARIIGRNGLIVPPNDTDAMADAIIAMAARSASERAAMGAAGRERIVREYALANVAGRYEELHAACLEQMARNGKQ